MKIITLFAGLLAALLGFTSLSEAQMNQSLTARQQSIVAIAAFTASGDLERLKPALAEGLQAGLTVNEIKEVLVQLYAYAGFPRSLNALGTFMALMDERGKAGIRDETGKEPGPMPEGRSSVEFGAENQTKLAGQPVAGPLFDFAPAIDQYLKGHLFGDIFQRDNLDWQSREIATIAALANIQGVNSQLRAHYAIGLNTGLTPAQLSGIVAVLRDQISARIAENAKQVLEETLKK